MYELFHDNKSRYGYRRIYDVLRNQGYIINRKKVQRIMRELDLYNSEIISFRISNNYSFKPRLALSTQHMSEDIKEKSIFPEHV